MKNPLSYVKRVSAERQAAAWNTSTDTGGKVCVVGPKTDGRYPLLWVDKVPDPQQAAWSVGHAATVLTFGVGTTINCDCGSSFHGATREEADTKWETHVLRQRVAS